MPPRPITSINPQIRKRYNRRRDRLGSADLWKRAIDGLSMHLDMTPEEAEAMLRRNQGEASREKGAPALDRWGTGQRERGGRLGDC